MKSPLTNDEVALAEQAYQRAHSESASSAEPDLIPDTEAPIEADASEEAVQGVESEREGLRMVFSMDMLLDVDVPDGDPLSGQKQKTE